MPYSSNNELPDSVKGALSAEAQSLFRNVVNSRLKAGASEERSFRQAWATVSRSYRKPDKGGKWIKKAEKQSLYVRRRLIHGDGLREWALAQGFSTTLPPEDFHVTIAYSKTPVEWPDPSPEETFITPEDPTRKVERLGDAVALRFDSRFLTTRWQELCDLGCSWAFPSYRAHITISWNVPEDFDLSKIEPFEGQLEFGPEEFSAIDESWSDNVVEKSEGVDKVVVELRKGHRFSVEEVQALLDKIPNVRTEYVKGDGGAGGKASSTGEATSPFFKVDEELGLAFGWAIICAENGKEYYDVQDDCVTEKAMLKASSDFMETKRSLKIMHAGAEVGKVIFAWPVTDEISKAMGITSKRTGLMIAVKPYDKTVLAKFKDGTWTGFSIGGTYGEIEEVE